jgi:hypothetical protein
VFFRMGNDDAIVSWATRGRPFSLFSHTLPNPPPLSSLLCVCVCVCVYVCVCDAAVRGQSLVWPLSVTDACIFFPGGKLASLGCRCAGGGLIKAATDARTGRHDGYWLIG